MEIAIMQQNIHQSNPFNMNQNDQNHSDSEEQRPYPFLLQVKKSHSTPHHSLNEKLNLVSDHLSPQEKDGLQEIKEQEKADGISEEHGSRNKEEYPQKSRMMMRNGQEAEMRKFSTAASEELKVDFPQHSIKSNSSSLCNISDGRINDNSGQKNDPSSKLENFTNIQRQEESKKLQTLYCESSEKNKLFEDKIRKNIKEFALDKYSHFILILVLEQGSAGHKRIIIESNLKEKELFSHEQFGHKVLNKCIEVSKNEFEDLYSEFIKYILDSNSKTYQQLQNDKFGNYVIQKCLETFEDEHLSELLLLLNTTLLIKPEQKLPSLPSEKTLKDNDLCSDQYGCLIIQKLIEIYKITAESKIKKQVGQMIEKVINDSHRLAQRQFSNYVVQQIIEKGAPEHKNLLYSNVISKQFIHLSMDKYGSNVAEKAVKAADNDQKKIIWNLISPNNFQTFFNMVNDQYANYVVQRIFDISSDKEKRQIYQQLNDWSRKNKLKENGKHPFKYIEDQMKQNENNHGQNQYRNNQHRPMHQVNTNIQHNYQQNRQPANYNHTKLNNNNNNNNGNMNNGQMNQSNHKVFNQNNNQNVDMGANVRQSHPNQSYGQKNKMEQQNNYSDSRGNQRGQQLNNNNSNSNNNNNNKNRNPNNNSNGNVNSNNSTNNFQQQMQNKQNQPTHNPPTDSSNSSQPDQSQQRYNKGNNFKNQNSQQQQSQTQQNNYHSNQKNGNSHQNQNQQQQQYPQSQKQQFNHSDSQSQSSMQNVTHKNYNNNNYQGGKRNYQQGENNYQYNNNNNNNHNGNRYPRRQNYGRGNYYNQYNNPYYYPNPQYYPQQYYQPCYPVMYPNQHMQMMDPAYMQQFYDPNNSVIQPNQPYFDFLHGAHIQVLQKKSQPEEEKKDLQSEITTQTNSLNSPQTQMENKVEEVREEQVNEGSENKDNASEPQQQTN